jgi:hypothetical protein
MVGGPVNGLRAAGKTALALEEAIKALELEAADQVLIDAAMGLAVKIDTLADERLLIRYHSLYSRAVGALSKRSDENRVRRVAEETRRREEEARRQARRVNPIAAMRAQRVKDDAARQAYNQRQAARAARLKEKGLTVAQVAEQMKCDPSIVEQYLAMYRAKGA